jgi:dimethylargininase
MLHGVLHLKSAVTALPDGTFVMSNPSLLDSSPFPTRRHMPEEAGAHVVLVGDGAVLMAESAPRSAEMLDDLGFDVITVDIGEFEKREGCVTCLSVLVAGGDP